MSQNTGPNTITVANTIQRKRFVNEKKLLDNEPLGYITAYPKEDNPLVWYILVVGQKGTHYEGGHFIGEIHHSPKYPAEPPDYIMRTPSGRYEINKKICLSNSGYHKGEWSATWNIHTILIAFYSIWLDDKEHGISHITRSKAERLQLAKESIQFNNSKGLKEIYDKFNHQTLSFDVDNDPKYGKNKKITNDTTNNTTTTNVTQPIVKPVVQPVVQPIVQPTINTIIEPKIEQINIEPVKTTELVKPVEPVKIVVDTQINNIVIEDEKPDNKIVIEEEITKKSENSRKNEINEQDNTRNVKQKINFQEIFSNINKINKSIESQEQSINNLMTEINM